MILLPAAEAGPRYQQLSTDISDVLNAEYPSLKLAPVEGRETSMRENNDGECILSIGTLRSLKYLSGLAGGWEPVMEALAEVLADAGFVAAAEDITLDEHSTGISSETGHGGKIQINVPGNQTATHFLFSAGVSDTDCKREVRR